MFFLRITSGTVIVPNLYSEADQILNEYFDYGVLNSHPLFMLNTMLEGVK
jgi:hypothetical protein